MRENYNIYQNTRLNDYPLEGETVENEISVLPNQPDGYVPIYIDEQPSSEISKIKRLNSTIIVVLVIIMLWLAMNVVSAKIDATARIANARKEAEIEQYMATVMYDEEMSLTIDGESIYIPAKVSDMETKLEEMGYEYAYINYQMDAKTELDQYDTEVYTYEKTDSATGDHTEITLSVTNDQDASLNYKDCKVSGIIANSNCSVISTEYGFSNKLTEDEIMDIIEENGFEYTTNEYEYFIYYDITISSDDYYKTISLQLSKTDYIEDEVTIYCID